MSSTRDADAKTTRLFDVRTVDRNIKKGLTTRKDYEKHLKALSDVADKTALPEVEPEDADEDADTDEPGASA